MFVAELEIEVCCVAVVIGVIVLKLEFEVC